VPAPRLATVAVVTERLLMQRRHVCIISAETRLSNVLIFRPHLPSQHRPTAYASYCYGRSKLIAWSVRLSVGLFVTIVSPAKTANRPRCRSGCGHEWIQGNVLDEVQISTRDGTLLRERMWTAPGRARTCRWSTYSKHKAPFTRYTLLSNRLTTGCIVYTNIQPVVKPV